MYSHLMYYRLLLKTFWPSPMVSVLSTVCGNSVTAVSNSARTFTTSCVRCSVVFAWPWNGDVSSVQSLSVTSG